MYLFGLTAGGRFRIFTKSQDRTCLANQIGVFRFRLALLYLNWLKQQALQNPSCSHCGNTVFAHMPQEHYCNSALIKHMDKGAVAVTDLKDTFSWLLREGILFSVYIGDMKAFLS